MSQDQMMQRTRDADVDMTPTPETAGPAPGAGRVQYKSNGAIPPVGAAFQAKGESDTDAAYDQTHAVAAAGVSEAGGALPHGDQIKQSFGAQHAATVGGISAHTGGKAAAASAELGAQAYATGDSVAFAAQPDLHTAAHEAAHVVQQKGGVQLKGGVGQQGDSYEQNADAVADRVVQGKDAADLLTGFGGASSAGVQSKEVQLLGHELGKPLPAGAEKPAFGEDEDQRRYSPEQYGAMWEKEQGKKLTTGNKATIDRGCIGLSANNIAGGGNPLDYAEVTFGGFDQGHAYMAEKNKELHAMRADPEKAADAPAGEYMMFAKMFWSNQSEGDNSAPDEDAFKADPTTGKVDMTGYEYKAQPGFVNFDYGWWDDNSNAFWHANHMQYKDPVKRKKDPMKVFQSTKEHFIAGYKDFDRCVFGVALATNYDPGKAAMDHASRAGGG